ncbi:hypothetical protein PHYBOEH_003780 [Phytophthora boehmeriae]|uniref:Uncharacterized protein n=1 Tax=Phytophthora boehmeriae TaxID=109152 RepID=A0A8T1WQD4_9STRA|nr:hypothetical protein PHYBOEH_003780 [Phytophthora boehmeriae]
MESTETGALYERILALVPVDKLHDSCNNILQEEIAPIDREVTDLKKAFAKIDDIRDAVIKLEQGSTSTGIRSVSLLEVMGSTMALQETLQKTLEKMTTGMAVDEKRFEKRRVRTDDTAEERKRKRESSIDENCGRSATASDLSSSESESESGSDTDSETHEEARDDVELNVADTSLKDTQSVKKRFLIDGETFLQDVATEFQRTTQQNVRASQDDPAN